MKGIKISPYTFVAIGKKENPIQLEKVFYHTHMFQDPREMEKKILDLEKEIISSKEWRTGLFETLGESFGKDSKVILDETQDVFGMLVLSPIASDDYFTQAEQLLKKLVYTPEITALKSNPLLREIIKKFPFHTMDPEVKDKIYFSLNKERMEGMTVSTLDEKVEDSLFEEGRSVEKIFQECEDQEACWAVMSSLFRYGLGKFYRKIEEGDVLGIVKGREEELAMYKGLPKMFEHGMFSFIEDEVPKKMRQSLPTILTNLVRDGTIEILTD